MSVCGNNEIVDKYKEIFDLADRIIDKGISLLVGKEVDSTLKEVMLYHFVRSVKLLKSIKILCGAGYATEANVLLRSMLNLVFNIGWIVNRKVEKRIQRFIEFEPVKKYLNGEKLKKFGRIPKEEKKKYKNFFKKEYEEYLKKYNITEKGDLFSKGWSGKSLEEMAREIRAAPDYHILYDPLSDLEHTGVHSIGQFLRKTEEARIMLIEPNEEGVANSLLTSLHYFLKILEISVQIFDLDSRDIQEDIEEHCKLYKRYLDKTVPDWQDLL